MVRTARILPLAEVRDVLSPTRLNLPTSPIVLDIVVDEYVNSAGEDALNVFVVLEDDVPEDESLWKQIEPIFNTIHDALIGAGESRFPYMSAGTREDLRERSRIASDDEE